MNREQKEENKEGKNIDSIRYKKSLGQNFIFDKNLLISVAKDAGITAEDTVLEVGTGAATLTHAIAQRAKRVITIEVDKSLAPYIQDTLSGVDNVTLVFSDILKLSHKEIADLTGGEFKVVANLPYYITTPVIFHLLESDLPLKSLTVTVQKEVALRMAAKPSTPDYGALSLSLAARGEAKLTRHINRKMFTPAPNVDSAVVRMDIVRPYNRELSRVIKSLFASRRKTILNNLQQSFPLTREQCVEALQKAGISENARGEQLGLGQVIALAKALDGGNICKA